MKHVNSWILEKFASCKSEYNILTARIKQLKQSLPSQLPKLHPAQNPSDS